MRLEMLEEAIEIMRGLWRGGQYSHRGWHYPVENARVYTLPEQPPDVLVSGFGPKAVELAGRVGDGYCAVMPEGELVERFRSAARDGKLAREVLPRFG